MEVLIEILVPFGEVRQTLEKKTPSPLVHVASAHDPAFRKHEAAALLSMNKIIKT